jgi:hypothetical protein
MTKSAKSATVAASQAWDRECFGSSGGAFDLGTRAFGSD